MPDLISAAALRRLQTLYSAYASRALDVVFDGEQHSRAFRLRWASESCGREITSFRELTKAEGNTLIDVLQTAVGQATEPPRRQRKKMDREAARAAGTEGRRDGDRGRISLPDQEDFRRIEDALTRLGWDQARLEKWLRSPSSPLGRKANPQVRTKGDANRVWWALKRILKREGKWTAA